MLDWIQTQFHQWQFRKVRKEFQQCITGESVHASPEILFRLIGLLYQLKPDFRKNIQGLSGSYQFKSEDNKVTVLATFDDEQITVEEALSPEADIVITFKDGRSIINSFFSHGKDILKTLNDNEVALQGNLNYVYKLGFLTNHIQAALNGELPQ
jgi:hypothetical protein